MGLRHSWLLINCRILFILIVVWGFCMTIEIILYSRKFVFLIFFSGLQNLKVQENSCYMFATWSNLKFIIIYPVINFLFFCNFCKIYGCTSFFIQGKILKRPFMFQNNKCYLLLLAKRPIRFLLFRWLIDKEFVVAIFDMWFKYLNVIMLFLLVGRTCLIFFLI